MDKVKKSALSITNLLFLFILVLPIAACSNNDEPENDGFSGSWYGTGGGLGGGSTTETTLPNGMTDITSTPGVSLSWELSLNIDQKKCVLSYNLGNDAGQIEYKVTMSDDLIYFTGDAGVGVYSAILETGTLQIRYVSGSYLGIPNQVITNNNSVTTRYGFSLDFVELKKK